MLLNIWMCLSSLLCAIGAMALVPGLFVGTVLERGSSALVFSAYMTAAATMMRFVFN